MAKKYYVVLKGHQPGIYETWDECKNQVHGYQGAKYKAFPSLKEAQEAFTSGWDSVTSSKSGVASLSKTSKSTNSTNSSKRSNNIQENQESILFDSISVDAACSGNPGDLEYQGVDTKTGEQLFHVGPLANGTNNIGEFLAIVHALALLKKQNSQRPIYSDSMTAIGWVKKKKANTQLEKSKGTAQIWNLIERAESWLHSHTYSNKIMKWETKEWGEIKADFGRK